MIYAAKTWALENELASLVKHLAAPIEKHAGRRIKGGLIAKTSFSEEQLEAIRNVRRHPFTIITGGPGVGKTTVVGEIVRQAVKSGLNVYLAAPTGRAAKRMSETCGRNAMTIHRMLKWDPVERKFAYGYQSRLPCEMLIVDETSMLDLQLAASLFRALDPGTAVVMVGDPDQLPSVGPGNVLMVVIGAKLCPTTHLSRIYRQCSGSRIITNAHRVNAGQLPETAPTGAESDFYWIEQDDPIQARDTIARMVAERIPAKFAADPFRDIQVLTPMNKGECGTAALNQMLQELLNPGPKPAFKVGDRAFKSGDRVMQIRNNYDKSVFNGDMGRLVNIDSKNDQFTVDYDGTRVDYKLTEADQITLAYAVTVHKSQGSEFPAVVIPILSQHFIMLRRNLLYTAITRAKKLLVLVGPRKAVSMAVSNFRVEPRYTMLREKMLALTTGR
jgi:exodeoxyribonuclease V alpha subunit